MKTIFHKASERGHADHGWLNAHHSFSFASWYDPSKVHFGLLRVLNDDIVAPGMGFGMHPHDNMEIVTIPLEGALEHKDNTGGHGVISRNEVQVMSAGTGVFHSEFNHSKTEAVKLFQIWVFPKFKNVTPRYDQKKFDPEGRKNKFQTLVSPEKEGENLWLHQDTVFSLADLDEGKELEYKIKFEGNGAYVMLVDGEAEVAGQVLGKRDAVGVWETGAFTIRAKKNSEVLVVEVPMN
ncbi:MAG TPA: pirin family protein [Bacteroidia bacterium]|jgi:redox-sensitive bicupin YhaK (pirin superfamily)